MEWSVYHGDILDVSADVLICPANVFLTLSGGVGGAFALRYGYDVQRQLECFLTQRALRHVNQGDVVTTDGGRSPFRSVLHAVAVDGFYECSQADLVGVIVKSLKRSAELAAKIVALSALATGYGRKPIDFFGEAIASAGCHKFPPIEQIVVGLSKQEDVEVLLDKLPNISRHKQCPF